MEYIKHEDVVGLLGSKKIMKDSDIFSVKFVKRTDGTERDMVCRLGVVKFLKGGQQPYNAKEKRLLTVFDISKKAYRNINLENVLELKTKGRHFKVSNPKPRLKHIKADWWLNQVVPIV